MTSRADRTTKVGHAIAYIDKTEAVDFYRHKLLMAFDEIEGMLAAAGNHADEGLVSKAGETLGKMKDRVAEARTDLFMLNFFGAPEKELSEMSGTVNAFLAAAGKLETELGRGTLLRLQCSSEDMDCREFEKTLKGHLSKMDCSFTDNTEEAAWTIEVGLDVREYNISEMGGMKIYTAYADALLTLEKRTGARKSVEDRVSEKGVHTLSYAEAGRDACARLGEALVERIYSIISQ